MNRRDFIKALGDLAAIFVVPVEVVGIEPKIREILGYDIYRNSCLIRHDIYDGKDQWSICHEFFFDGNKIKASEEDIAQAREIASLEFTKFARERGISWGSLIQLPFPKEFEHARYI